MGNYNNMKFILIAAAAALNVATPQDPVFWPYSDKNNGPSGRGDPGLDPKAPAGGVPNLYFPCNLCFWKGPDGSGTCHQGYLHDADHPLTGPDSPVLSHGYGGSGGDSVGQMSAAQIAARTPNEVCHNFGAFSDTHCTSLPKEQCR